MNNSDLLKEIEPQLEVAYQNHMAAIKNPFNDDDKDTKRPFSPTEVLAQSAKTSTDPLEYGAVFRDDFKQHLLDFEENFGVDVKPVLAASFLVNLLTEDNLPHYTSRINSNVVNGSPSLALFANEWTAEEDVHGVIMRDYALLSGMIGDDELSLISNNTYHQGRVNQLRSGTEINPTSIQHAFSYLALQEHLTKEAHKNEGWILPLTGRRIMNPVAGDEQNHYEFYLTACKAALNADTDTTLIALSQVYSGFSMPGAIGIPNFNNLALTIGVSGIFDLETIAKSMQTIANKLEISTCSPTTNAGKIAQEQLLKVTSSAEVKNKQRLMERIRSSVDIAPNDECLMPFILNKTVELEYAGSGIHKKPRGLKPMK